MSLRFLRSRFFSVASKRLLCTKRLLFVARGKPSGNESPLFDSDMVKAVFVQIVQLLGSSNIEIALKDPHTRKKYGWGILAAHLVSTIIFMIPIIFRGGRSIKEVEVFDRLDDLKGVDQLKIELKEIVYCASDPKGFIQLGGKFPQSVLLVGLPGSGKKMSARAIAREAGVHFFPCNARVLQESEYDAEWVKDMFKDAKRSPCVVFIDEIDAIGQNPKDQSLKQVIDELNGIRENEKIIVIGATNNPNALDMSLLRHGLFDRRIIIPYPDIDGRRKILESHLSKVPSADDVDVITLARRTLGFSAVDLAYLINSAVLKVLADGGKAVDMNALEFALMGSQRRKPVVSEEVKKRIVFHEAGHAIVAVHSCIPLLSATIVPRDCHLGVVCQESHADETRQQLLARLDVYMGGRYAEEVFFGSTGVTSSESDLFLATSLATAMVTRYGMSSKLGPVSHIVDSGRSSKTQVTIEEEVKKMLEQAYKNAKAVVDKHRKELDLLAHALMEHETLSETQIIEYAGVRSG